MSGAIPPLPQYVFMAWCSVKHRDKFTFTLPYPSMKESCEINVKTVGGSQAESHHELTQEVYKP
jgi:hypothetical protein